MQGLYQQTVLSDGPTGYWMLDETTGTSAADSTGNGLTGTYTGGFTLAVAGPSGGLPSGVSLNGTTGYVSLGSPAKLNVGTAWTSEAWVKPTNFTGTPEAWGTIASSWATAFGTTGLAIANAATGGATHQAIAATTVTAGSWYHLVGVWDGSNVYCYVNGRLVAGPVAATGSATSNTGPWSIGQAGADSAHFLNGSVSNVAVYGKALSADRILVHYNAALFPPAPQPAFLPLRLGPAAVGPTFFAAFPPPPSPAAAAGSSSFTDAVTGAIIFGGAPGEAKIGSDARTGAIIFGGAPGEAKIGSDSRSGAIIFGGAAGDLKTYADVRTGALIFGGSVTPVTIFTDLRTGAIVFGGAAGEVIPGTHFTDLPAGILIFGGTVIPDVYTPPVYRVQRFINVRFTDGFT